MPWLVVRLRQASPPLHQTEINSLTDAIRNWQFVLAMLILKKRAGRKQDHLVCQNFLIIFMLKRYTSEVTRSFIFSWALKLQLLPRIWTWNLAFQRKELDFTGPYRILSSTDVLAFCEELSLELLVPTLRSLEFLQRGSSTSICAWSYRVLRGKELGLLASYCYPRWSVGPFFLWFLDSFRHSIYTSLSIAFNVPEHHQKFNLF